MTARSRLDNFQIAILRSLAIRGGNGRAITLKTGQRTSALPLWRRGIVEIWYRQSPDEQPSLQGPYYALTIIGARLAAAFLNPAPRGLPSGAEQSP
jgi:hypothetical protein